MYFPSSFKLIIFFWMAIFFWLFQFQLQFFTLNTENSDKTKSWKVDCDSDLTNLSLQERICFSESLLHEPPSSDLTIGGGTRIVAGCWHIYARIHLHFMHLCVYLCGYIHVSICICRYIIYLYVYVCV